MIFHLHIPSAPLRDYVHDIFYYEAEIAPYEAEKLLPDNTIYLIINFTEEEKKLFHDVSLGKYNSYKKAWISGMQRKYLVIEATNNNRMMVVRFKSGMAYPFFNVPINKFSDDVLESDDILGSEISSLREELLNTPDVSARCRRMEQYLTGLLMRQPGSNAAVDFLVRRLSDPHTLRETGIKQLIDKTGYSHKHMLHLFEKQVGLTPKYFARIAKFQQVLKNIDAGKPVSWASLANEYGFYDQAHFINDFKHFSGINPSAYFTERAEDFNYLVVR